MLIKIYHPVKENSIVNRHAMRVYYVPVTELGARDMMGELNNHDTSLREPSG